MSDTAVRSEVERLTGQATRLFACGLIEEASRVWRATLSLLVPCVLPETETQQALAAAGAGLAGNFAVQPLMGGSILSPPPRLTLADRVFTLYASTVH
jgi:hypothetical protein